MLTDADESCSALKPRPTLLIAEDSEDVQEHLRSILDKEYQLVGFFRDGIEVLQMALQLRPDFITLDVSLPNMTGFEIAKHLLAAGIPTKIIFVSQHKQSAYLSEAKRLGGSGYVYKNRVRTDLLPAIQAVRDGELCFPK